MSNPRIAGRLELQDGSVFDGILYGSPHPVSGEVVFQTGMVGYVESLTDPSYHSQLLVLTYVSIGNYGVPSDNEKDNKHSSMWFESNHIQASALVVSEICLDYSHFAANDSLHDWLYRNNVVCISGIDTRALTLQLRSHGTILGRIYPKKCIDLPPWFDPAKENIVTQVTCEKIRCINTEGDVHIAIFDCGMKMNQIRCFESRNVKLTILPYGTDLCQLGTKFDALFVSNGPGDPAQCTEVIEQIIYWMKLKRPLFGICLGHQLLARAINLPTYKMKYGNRGHNQPCVHIPTERCFITSQNHGYAVDASVLPTGWDELFRNANDGSNEGLIHQTEPWMTVQFHPEHMAGPRDLECLFDVFINHLRDTSSTKPTLSNSLTQALTYTQQPFEVSLTDASRVPRKVLLLGSGGLSIGQAGEFDYSGSQALKALKEEGVQTILINPNIATVQTTTGMADKVFLLPVTPEHVGQIIEVERPDGIMISFGGQTGLTCGLALNEATVNNESAPDLSSQSVLERYNCRLLGTPALAIELTEDRQKFADAMRSIGEKVAPAESATTVEHTVTIGNKLGYPVLIRAAFALGGMGSGFAHNAEELAQLARRALAQTSQVFIDKSLKGWKEVEYEVMRDAYDNCITICNMENLDPVGIHTGDSIVVAPSQTLSNVEYNILRSVSIKVVRFLRVVGECNIQFALDPNSLDYYIIEVNARLSRSSALASKATGCPLAYIAAKLGLGHSLASLTNAATGGLTTACFEPSLDYCVVKVPRWDLSKFTRVNHNIGSSMKSVGEAMGISRCFEEALQKALRMTGQTSLGFQSRHSTPTDSLLSEPTENRIFVVASALRADWSVDRLHKLTGIDRWFLHRLANIVACQRALESVPDTWLPILLHKTVDLDSNNNISNLSPSSAAAPSDLDLASLICQLATAKRLGFSDDQLGHLLRSSALVIRRLRVDIGLLPAVRRIDTVAGEWPATTNYLYTTYGDLPPRQVLLDRIQSWSAKGQQLTPELIAQLNAYLSSLCCHDVEFGNKSSIIVLGSGVYRIGSSVEFDWCGVECVKELRRLGRPTVTINCNPETVSTDFDECDRLYFEELSFERVADIYALESPIGVVVSMGGQTPNNIAMQLHRHGCTILGTSAESIDSAENRFKFSRLLDGLSISQPRWKELTDLESARAFCEKVGYPCLVRPSYVLSGAAMNVAYDHDDLVNYLSTAQAISPEQPVVITQFILDAKEIDVDAIAQSGRLVACAVSEHIENAGVHSGDATLVTPPQDLNAETLNRIHQIVVRLSDELQVSGPFNLQLIAKNNQLSIIEVNLRVSRSLPFVSKTLNYNFVAAATRSILASSLLDISNGTSDAGSTNGDAKHLYCHIEPTVDLLHQSTDHVGVKVPVFSFSRLLGADVLLGVEMVSTGEVACFGPDQYHAYLLAQSAALHNANGHLPIPGDNVFLSIGTFKHKVELTPSIRQLHQLGFRLYGSPGTADFYQAQNIPIISIDWPYEEDSDGKKAKGSTTTTTSNGSKVQQSSPYGLQRFLAEKHFGLIVCLTMRKPGYRRPVDFVTRGYRTRRLAIETNVPLFTDVKLVKLLIASLVRRYGLSSLLSDRQDARQLVDFCQQPPPFRLLPLHCITSSRVIYLPGLIDIHVHTRDPGHEYKEDWSTVTRAALAGGVVTLLAMPNTNPPVVDLTSFYAAIDRASARAHCDFGLYAGATVENADCVADQLSSLTVGLKLYLNQTFTTLNMANRIDVWRRHFQNWPKNRPVCCHAEGETVAAVILLAEFAERHVHICHISRKDEVELIRDAKARGVKITCEVCPHHLFLAAEDLPAKGGWAEVRPRLASRQDVEALWANLDVIDCFATDHAPHTKSEKSSPKAPPGFPGLETMLPLLLTAVTENRMTLSDLVDKLYTNPKRLFGLDHFVPPPGEQLTTDQLVKRCIDRDNSWVEVDMTEQWRLPGSFPIDDVADGDGGDHYESKADWSPFGGRLVRGKVRRVMLRGKVAYVDGHVYTESGYGQNVMMHQLMQPAPAPAHDTATLDHQTKRSRNESSCGGGEYAGIRYDDATSLDVAMASGGAGDLGDHPAPTVIKSTVPPFQPSSISPTPSLWLNGLSGCHLLTSTQLTKKHLHHLFNWAHTFRQATFKQKSLTHICNGKVMMSLFFEPSTRTSISFASAMQRLGGSVVNFDQSLSSINKGESLADTVRVLCGYSDLLVVRHPGQGVVQSLASSMNDRPVVNAGDGVGEHPTQALLDVFTIREEIGTVNGLTVTMVGDLANGRTVHSLAHLLCLYNVRLRYVTPCEELRMPDEIRRYVSSQGIHQEEFSDLASALPDTDVLYMTRLQIERLSQAVNASLMHQSGDNHLAATFVITPEVMAQAKPTTIVMHPLPRVCEISPAFDSDPRAVYFRQAEYGMYVRMAILATLMASRQQQQGGVGDKA